MQNKPKKFLKWYILGLLFLCLMAFALPNSSSVQDFFIDDTLYSQIIQTEAKKYNIDPNFIRAIIYRESKFNKDATGKAGEVGLMQIIPKSSVADWARVHKKSTPTRKELFDPQLNIEIGTWYLSVGMDRYRDCQDQKELALCRYNAGATNSEKWRKATPKGKNVIDYITFPSTKSYVKTIINKYINYCKDTVIPPKT